MHTDKTLLEQSSVAGIATTIFGLAILGWIALRTTPLPAPAPADAPPARFSAARAFAHVAVLAQNPHPTGTEANAQARSYLLGQLRALGLEPHVQTATAQKTRVDHWKNAQATVAVVNNIVARMPGSAADRATRPALLLAVHYDSAPTSLGAADAGAPVAAALETLRALRSLPPLQNDLIVLFTDGERAGALGARAFADEHPWARDVGLVLQFASGGTRGPQMLYDTRGGDGAIVGGWARAVPLPLGSSLMHEVHALKDAGPLQRLGRAALLFNNIEGAPDYFGSLDTPDRLDQASLQHLGDTMLGMVRHFGMQPLAGSARDDDVYFELPVVGLVHYPASWTWPLTRLVGLLFVGVYCLARQRSNIERRDVQRGALAFVLITGAMAFSAYLVWQALPMLHPGYNPRMGGAGTHDHLYLLAFGSLGGALFIYLQRKVQAITGAPAAALGALLAMVLALPLVSWLMPGASYLLTWPLFGALFAFAMLYLQPAGGLPQRARVAILVGGLAPAVLLIVPAARDVYTLFTPDSMNLPITLLALLLGLGTALLSTLPRRYAVRPLGLACVALLLAARAPHPYGSEPPHPNRLTYLKDAYSWKAFWVAPAHQLDDWNRPYFRDAPAPRQLIETYDYDGPLVWAAAAPHSEVGFPSIAVLKDEDGERVRHVEFELAAKSSVPTIALRIEGAHALRTMVGGRVLTSTRNNTWSATLHGMGGQRLRFKFDVEPDKAFRIVVEERTPGLPPHEVPVRLGTATPRLTPLTEMTVASDTLVFR